MGDSCLLELARAKANDSIWFQSDQSRIISISVMMLMRPIDNVRY